MCIRCAINLQLKCLKKNIFINFNQLRLIKICISIIIINSLLQPPLEFSDPVENNSAFGDHKSNLKIYQTNFVKKNCSAILK